MSQYFRRLTKTQRLNQELDRLKAEGKTFTPADLAKKFDLHIHGVMGRLWMRNDIYQILRSEAVQPGLPYKSSVWGFREVPV